MSEKTERSQASWAERSTKGQLQSIPVTRGYRSTNQFRVESRLEGSKIAGVRSRFRWWDSWEREQGMKKESGRAAWQSEVAGKDEGWITAEVTGKRLE